MNEGPTVGREEVWLLVPSMISRTLRAACDALGIVAVEWHRYDPETWLATHLPRHVLHAQAPPLTRIIEARAAATAARGPQTLWDGYDSAGVAGTRRPGDVRTDRAMGRLFARLAIARRPDVIVEVGTAFGVSGMYWLAGLGDSGTGRLYTFEPNAGWAAIARDNLAAVGTRFESIVGTFEDSLDAQLPDGRRIDMAFVDAIHTSAWVEPQFELIVDRLSPGGLVLLDDITFSADMAACWQRIASDERVRASASLSRRVGVVELP